MLLSLRCVPQRDIAANVLLEDLETRKVLISVLCGINCMAVRVASYTRGHTSQATLRSPVPRQQPFRWCGIARLPSPHCVHVSVPLLIVCASHRNSIHQNTNLLVSCVCVCCCCWTSLCLFNGVRKSDTISPSPTLLQVFYPQDTAHHT